MSNSQKAAILGETIQTNRLTPQYLQVVQLVQVPEYMINNRIDDEIEKNPVLEYDTTNKVDVKVNEKQSEYTRKNNAVSREYADWLESSMVYSKSLFEHLMGQLLFTDLTPEQLIITKYIVSSLDNDGYFKTDISVVINDILINYGIVIKEVDVVNILKRVQILDPVGIGARSLQECLLLQLSQCKQDSQDFDVSNAICMLSDLFDDFRKKRFDRIIRKLNITNDDFQRAYDVILSLNPFPGRKFTTCTNNCVTTPDFIVTEDNGKLSAIVNFTTTRRIKINNKYREVLDNKSDVNDELYTFIKKKIDSANGFLNAIEQRKIILGKTIQAILKVQYDYFLYFGNVQFLKPMVLKDIAGIVGVDMSTMSRIVSNKTIQTDFGIITMKSLFSESIQTNSGDEVSNKAIKDIISVIIRDENKKFPVSDQKIMTMLNKQGYQIARRTVAKYRKQLKIPVCRLRKDRL